jgi:hypothetical protein
MTPLYKALANKVNSLHYWRGKATHALDNDLNDDYYEHCLDRMSKVEEDILAVVKEYMPSGSGIDNGTKIDLDKSTSEKLVFTFGFHHMNGNGYYTGWSDYKLIVIPSLIFDIKLKISGKDTDLKEYLHDVYYDALNKEKTVW